MTIPTDIELEAVIESIRVNAHNMERSVERQDLGPADQHDLESDIEAHRNVATFLEEFLDE